MQDAKLYEVAKKVKCKTWFEVGLKLGLKAIELDHLEENNSRELVERRIFNMLRMWRDRQLSNGGQKLKLNDVLYQVFSDTTNSDALELLEQSP